MTGVVAIGWVRVAAAAPCDVPPAPVALCGTRGVHCPGPNLQLDDVQPGDVVVLPALTGAVEIEVGGAPGLPVTYLAGPYAELVGQLTIRADDVVVRGLPINADLFGHCVRVDGDGVELVEVSCTGSTGGFLATDVTGLRVVASRSFGTLTTVELRQVTGAYLGCNLVENSIVAAISLFDVEDVVLEANLLLDHQPSAVESFRGRNVQLLGNVIEAKGRAVYGDAESAGWRVIGNTVVSVGFLGVALDLDGGADHLVFGNVLAADGTSLDLEQGGASDYNLLYGSLASAGTDAHSVKTVGWPLVDGPIGDPDAYRLAPGSPGFDFVPVSFAGGRVPPYDLEGNVRPCGERSDAGAFETCDDPDWSTGTSPTTDTGAAAEPPAPAEGGWQVTLGGGCSQPPVGGLGVCAAALVGLRRRSGTRTPPGAVRAT